MVRLSKPLRCHLLLAVRHRCSLQLVSRLHAHIHGSVRHPSHHLLVELLGLSQIWAHLAEHVLLLPLSKVGLLLWAQR